MDAIFTTSEVVRAGLNTNTGNLEIVRRYPSNMAYGNGTPVPDRVEKEVYGVIDGKIALIQTIQGKHEPAYRVEERITFDV